ncbi:MAG: cysteine-rich small domain-containing protein [Proteobacteria bacterium]|nr:cysteine-rich small domain-containing protein [Pseudomonadota bacterium]MBU1611588.1 cysteine-rich small domain-containing protein [Pseudomonadota bacterium]
MENSFRFFSNRDCTYFPCHQTSHPERFNCLFCYCPLYFFPDCGGRFKPLKGGLKDCTDCRLPHNPEGYDHIVKRLRQCFRSGCTVSVNDD